MNKITGIILVFLLLWGITSAEEKTTELKILQVKKIVAVEESGISRQEIIKYLPDAAFQPDSQNKEIPCDLRKDYKCCRDSSSIKTVHWVDGKRIPKNCEDTNRCMSKPSVNQGAPNTADYYYVKQNDSKSDSLIFIEYYWDCPNYKKYYTFLDGYPFADYNKTFNYLGNNSGAAEKAFPLKPYYWDEYQEKYTQFIPSVPFNDSSSLLIYSLSGFNIKHEMSYASKPAEKEKELILENLLKGIPNVSCIMELTLQKLLTVDGVSRFAGRLVTIEPYRNSWYVADIKGDQCLTTVLEIRDYYESEFCCAYAFGKNNLPDVYIFVSDGDTVRKEKEIFYKSDNHWFCSMTQEEYKGNCLEEPD